MTITTDKLAKILQTLFTTEADTAAKESGMIQRRRKISGAGFVQTLVFGWLEDPTTTIDELGDELNVSISLGSTLWGQTDFHSLVSPLFGVRPIPLFGTLWGTLWGQTDLEFSPLRPRARSSARRSRLVFDSLWSRAANRADRLGTLSGRERPRSGTSWRGWPRYGASPGRRGQRGLASGSHARRVGPGRPRTSCTPPRSPGRDPILEAGVAPGAGRGGPDRRGAGADDPGIAHCRGAIHAVPRQYCSARNFREVLCECVKVFCSNMLRSISVYDGIAIVQYVRRQCLSVSP